jgi:DNA-3-methyladenine glycosylase
MKKLPLSFYRRDDVVQIAKELLGKLLVSNAGGKLCSGRIVETEAYAAFTDKASHSYNGKRTPRNEHMYAAAGTAYVYICYGMHQMFNVVTNKKEIPDAILIRGIEPVAGIPFMLKRRGMKQADASLTKGPGNLGKALGISTLHSGLVLNGDILSIWQDHERELRNEEIGSSKRIGVDSAGPDANLPYRFYIRGNKYVSGRPVK